MGLRLLERYHAAWFKLVHGSNLVYNTCWEDPRLDRVALDLGPRDTIVMITSAGCNALDYALVQPRHIFCVDMNPRQNALLQLKQAAIRELDFEDFFQIFGRGRHKNFHEIYTARLRRHLTPRSRHYWDRHQRYFNGRGWRNSFYFEGTSGLVARLMNTYINRKKGLRQEIDLLLEAKSVEEQREIYDRSLRPFLRGKLLKMLLGRDTTMSLLGVPRQQREQVEKHYGGGIAEFIEDCLESVFAKLPIHDNYFWRVYLKGEYTAECCPEYLKPDNFAALKGGLVDKITTHTKTVEGFLRTAKVPITRFVLLDHMDWLSANRRAWLESEWQAIVDRAAPQSRILFRSGGMKVEYVDPIRVRLNGSKAKVGDLLTYNTALANELHEKDRVHTYGSFYIADMNKG
jgi:S-adenosylmethionine-diacylglycerol 3-amino-3-carboxypropyl transferase